MLFSLHYYVVPCARALCLQELLRFSLTDWETLVDDAGMYDRVDRDKVKLVFLQVQNTAAQYCYGGLKMCCWSFRGDTSHRHSAHGDSGLIRHNPTDFILRLYPIVSSMEMRYNKSRECWSRTNF